MAAEPGTRFVGREAELAALDQALAAALRGEGQLVLLVGEPGIGKTRTARALADAARARGASVAWGHCPESEAAPSYWPFLQALESCAAERADAASLELRELVALLRADEALEPEEAVPERARFALCHRVAAALAASARQKPLALVLDDAHWADEGSLVLLEYLARQLAGVPLLVLATVREDALAAPPAAVSNPLARLLRLARVVNLRGLPPGEVAELLADRLGAAAEERVVSQVVELCDGNPFFVIEVAHVLAAGGESRVPPGVRELLRRRLEPLSPAARRVLDAAAVAGRAFELGALARALDQPIAETYAALGEPLAHGLLRPLAGALRRFEFGHALLRETLYDALGPSTRTALHHGLALALEAEGAVDDERLAALAHHFFEAAQLADPAKAVGYCCDAGERALHQLAFEDAVRHFDRALAGLALRADPRARSRALRGLYEGLHFAGRRERADLVFRDAVAAARAESPAAFAQTVLRFASVRTELATLDVEMNELLEAVLAALPAPPTELRARAHALLSVGLRLQPGSELRRAQLADTALALAREVGDPGTLSFVLSRRLVGRLGPDHLQERLAISDEILRSEGRTRVAELDALCIRISDLGELGERARLDHALEVFGQKARAARQPFYVWLEVSFRAAMAILEGRFAEAEALVNEALALGLRLQPRSAPLRYAQQLFMLRGWQGRLDEVGPLVERGVSATGVVPAWRAALADYYCVAGREAEARREFDALAADGFASLVRDATWLPAMLLLAATCGRLGDRARAATLYALLRPFAGRVALSSPLVVMTGPVDTELGALASLCGDHAAAEEHLAQALALAERMRALTWQGDILYEHALALQRRAAEGDRERAAALLDRAEALARTAGMQLLLGWIARARNAPWPAEPAAAERRPDAAPARSGAFRREGELWTLELEGRTTRVRDMVGLAHLARLLAQPDREMHAEDLVAAVYAPRREPGAASAGPRDAGPVLDQRARAEYLGRLREARAELEEARRLHDFGLAEKLSDEIEILAAQLADGFGLGGRGRRAGSTAERARLSVTRAIKYAIDRVGEHDPALAEHLRRGVRTGTFCVYAPGTRDSVTWSL